MEAGRTTSGNKPATPATAKRKASHPLAQELRAGIGALASSNVKKKAKQASSFKVHLGSPFVLKWSPVAEDVRNEVVERLSRELGEYKRIRVKKERKKRKAPPAGDQSASATNTPSANKNKKKRTKKTNKKTKNKEDKTTATATGTPAAVPKDKDVMELEGEAEQKEVMQVATKPLKERSGKTQAKDTEADAEARETARQKLIAKRQEVREKCTFMAVGLNAVTKALEDKQLEVVVVCKDVEPARLVQHIPVQAFLTGVPLVPLSGDLSLRLGAIFGIRTVMAIGFKRGTEHPHGDLVAFLKSQAVPLNIPWLLPCKTATSGQAGSAQADGTATTVTVPEPLPLHSFKARVAQPNRSSSSSTPQKQRGTQKA